MIQVNYFVPNKLSTSDKFYCYLGAPWIGTTLHSRSECLWFNWWLIYRVRKITEFTVLANCFLSLTFYKWRHSSSHTLLTFDSHLPHLHVLHELAALTNRNFLVWKWLCELWFIFCKTSDNRQWYFEPAKSCWNFTDMTFMQFTHTDAAVINHAAELLQTEERLWLLYL